MCAKFNVAFYQVLLSDEDGAITTSGSSAPCWKCANTIANILLDSTEMLFESPYELVCNFLSIMGKF